MCTLEAKGTDSALSDGLRGVSAIRYTIHKAALPANPIARRCWPVTCGISTLSEHTGEECGFECGLAYSMYVTTPRDVALIEEIPSVASMSFCLYA